MEYTKGDMKQKEKEREVSRMVCGCLVMEYIDNLTIAPWIVYCPKHKAAPDMYEALKLVRDTAVLQKEENGYYILRLEYSSWKDVCEALAKAEEK